MKRQMILLIMVLALGLTAGVANALDEYFEDFETGFAGSALEAHAEWYAQGPTVTAGVGVNGSVGLPADGQIFQWVEHAFSWANDLAVGDIVIMGMDFEASTGSLLDDDRLGWMHTTNSVTSDFIFAVQADPGGGGQNIECYWENGGGNNRNTIVDTSVVADTWYRMRATYTKLTDTSCSIDVSIVDLDGSGNPIPATEITGNVPDSSLSLPLYSMDYFENALQYPAYKNYTGDGAADNAYFAIGSPDSLRPVNPEDGSRPLVTLAELEWHRPDPNGPGSEPWQLPDPFNVNVIFGTDSDLDPVDDIGASQIVTNEDTDTTSNFTLAPNTDYYWRVNIIDPNDGIVGHTVTTEGPIWIFSTTVLPGVIVTPIAIAVSEEGPTADTYTVTLSKSPPQPVTVTPGPTLDPILDLGCEVDSDDSEEHIPGGAIESLTSSDLELGWEDNSGDQQLIGLRFNNVNIPNGATITGAYMQFNEDEATSGECNLNIFGELSPNVPSTFTTTAFDLSSRPRTSAEVAWTAIPAWSGDNDYQTPDITSIISEITGQAGWSFGNSLVLLIEPDAVLGSPDKRVAESSSHATKFPLLHIEWTVGTGTLSLPVTWSPSSVELTDTNWSTGLDITVTAVDDTDLELDPHVYVLPNAVSSADAEWNALTADDVEVTISENECGAWDYSPFDYNLNCWIDLPDIAEFAGAWMDCSMPNDAGGLCIDYR